ncbi:MAG: response regulator, partial [Oligoflexia bacterium]|nr:response regulator [Oligoflexia bacterium]
MTRPLILIIDDNADTRELVRLMLSRHDVDTVEAPDAKEGLRIVLSGKVDVIILDMLMPGMRGFEFVKLIREKEIVTPVIAISNLRDRNAIKYALGLGVDDYIIKPIDRHSLLEKINYYTGDLVFDSTFECEIPAESRYSEAVVNIKGYIYRIDELGIALYMNGMPESGSRIRVESPVLEGSGIDGEWHIVERSEYVDDDSLDFRYRVFTNFLNEPDRGRLRSWLISKANAVFAVFLLFFCPVLLHAVSITGGQGYGLFTFSNTDKPSMVSYISAGIKFNRYIELQYKSVDTSLRMPVL